MAYPQRRSQRGLSLVEHLAVLTVVSLTLGSALPELRGLAERARLDARAALLETDLQHARSLAVARDQVVRVSFGAAESGGCYVVHTGEPQACTCTPATEATACVQGAEALRTEWLAPSNGITLRSNSASIAFEPIRGTVTPTATMRLSNRRGDALHVVVNIMGRVRSCIAEGSLSGYKAC